MGKPTEFSGSESHESVIAAQINNAKLGRRGLFALAGLTTGAVASGVDLHKSARAVEAAVASAPTVIDTQPANRDGQGRVVLEHWQSGEGRAIAVPEWFAPHRSLRWQSDVSPLDISLQDLEKWDDFEFALNTRRPGGPLAGYSYDENDFSRAVDPNSTEQLQVMLYGWSQLGGRRMMLPGIGHIEGAHRTPVVCVIANRADNVHKWDAANPIMVESGFMAAGRLWNAGDSAKVRDFEAEMVKHKLSRQAYGTGDGKFEGVSDHPDNALKTRVVTVQRRRNGDQNTFQFIRAQEFTFNK